jgi:putative addiction module component (TIGR02574 family)
MAGGRIMTKQTQSILDEALKLPSTEKLALVEGILTSLSTPDADWNQAWSKEAAIRMAEYKAGQVEAIDADDVFAELEASLQ